jgi:hypothetical protein
MFEEIDKAAQRAMEANVKPPLATRIFRGLKKWWDNQPPIVVICFGVVTLAVLVLITGFEALNSARGWVMVTKDAMPSQVAFFAGCSVTIGYVVFHRRASERARDVEALRDDPSPNDRAIRKAEGRMWKAAAVAIIFASLSLWGIFSNLASKTALVAREANETNGERTQLQADIIILENEVDSVNVDLISALILSKEAKLASMTAEARGWGMLNLDVAPPKNAPADYPGPACLTDLKPRQRDLCNAAHGTVDADGLVGEIAALQADLKQVEAKRDLLSEKRAALLKVHAVEGAEHWNAMNELSAGNVSADQFRIWGMFLASLLFLFGAGFGWDELFEEVQRRKRKP